MTVKVAINGFGRIGRAVLRANFELEPAKRKIQIVAINDLASLKQMRTLLSLIVRTDVLVRQSMFLKMQFK